MDINQIIADHGFWFYPFVVLWTFLEGETLVLFAGFAAAQGLVDPWLLVIAAWLGSAAGDQFYFWLARHCGIGMLDRFPRGRQGVDAALHWLERYDAWFILSFRFIYGVRNISSFALGLSAVRWDRFLWLNLVAAALWAATFVAVGYFLGHAFRAILPEIARSFSLTVLGLFIVVSGGLWLWRRRQRQRQSVRMPAGAKPVLPPP